MLRDRVAARPAARRQCSGPPGRRHLRAVPRVLRTQAAGLREGPDQLPRASAGSSTSCCSCSASRGRRTSEAHGPGHRVVPERPVPGLQVERRHGSAAPARQFPIAEQAIEALGVVLWPMVEWEADDAIAAPPPVRRRSARRTDRDLHARQGHGPARRRRPHRPVGSATRHHLRRARGADEVGRRARKRPRPARARWRQLRRLSRAARVGRRPRRRCSRSTSTSRRSRHRRPPGRSEGCAARSALPRPSATGWTRRSCIAISGHAPNRQGRRRHPAAGPRGASLAGRRPRDLGGVLRSMGPRASAHAPAPLALSGCCAPSAAA